MRVDVWSDIACPWCYIGKRRLEAALAQWPGEVEVVWRAFELDPAAPRERDPSVSYAERLAKKYRTSVAQAEGMLARMTAVARADGLDFRFDRVRSGNTFDAHRLIHFARERGVQDVMKERLLRAYMTEGEPIGDPSTLARLARDVGLEAEDVLANGAYADEVRADEREAAALGIDGVPFFVFDRRCAASGAQPPEVLLAALERAHEDALVPGAACGPSGCP